MYYTLPTDVFGGQKMKDFEAVIGYESVKAELGRICDVLTDPAP